MQQNTARKCFTAGALAFLGDREGESGGPGSCQGGNGQVDGLALWLPVVLFARANRVQPDGKQKCLEEIGRAHV